jgi:N-methylhydantoinase A
MPDEVSGSWARSDLIRAERPVPSYGTSAFGVDEAHLGRPCQDWKYVTVTDHKTHSYSLAVDIGGTFTDVVLQAHDGRLWIDKTLTTSRDLLEGFFRGVRQVLTKANVQPADVRGVVVHATTTVTNALIERKGPITALLVTEGFKDVLTIRAEHRYDIYDLQIEFAEPLIPASLTFGVDERVLSDGGVAKEVAAEQIVQIAAELRKRYVASVAVCLLNSYRNPINERRIAALLTRELPDVYVSLSSDVAPQIREYPRASTTAINAFTRPIAEPYLRALAGRLEQEGFLNKPLIMLSSGGIIGAEVAGRNPVRMIESGPAAGALAATHFANQLGLSNLMSFDMGGTTAKACLIQDGRPLVSGSQEVDRRYRLKEGSGMPVTVPAIDLIEIGAGGGSIASIDALGLLKVGPRSAGSEPGPACYGRGGVEPTVTDGDLILGFLDADNFLGGDMTLDLQAARDAYARLADQLGKNAVEAAAGVYRIVAETMAAAVRAHATDRGIDHRGIPLLAFGGAGPVHACLVGELLQSRAVIFPPQPSVLSAFGTLVSPARLDLVRSGVDSLADLNWNEVDRIFEELTADARVALSDAGLSADEIRFQFAADLRYSGQQTEVPLTLAEDPRVKRDAKVIEEAFAAAYRKYYGVAPSHVPVEIVNWRLIALGPAVRVSAPAPVEGIARAPKGRRPVHLWNDQSVPVYDRRYLSLGQVVDGPALIEERETTIALPSRWRAVTDKNGCIIATPARSHG